MDTASQLYIVLRQSPDWATQTYADLEHTRAFCRLIGRREDFVIERVKLWDRTFPVRFFDVRQAMKEISLANFHSIAGAKLVGLEEARKVLRPNAFYLFTDDDDWFDPHIGEVLSRFDPKNCATVLWLSAVYSTIPWQQGISGSGITLRSMDDVFYTNNYAVSGAFLLQRPGNFDLVAQHFEAQSTFRRKRFRFNRRLGLQPLMQHLFARSYQTVIRLDRYCSVTNKHPASFLVLESLGDVATPESLGRQLCQALMANTAAPVAPPECRWSQPYMDRVSDFMARVVRGVGSATGKGNPHPGPLPSDGRGRMD